MEKKYTNLWAYDVETLLNCFTFVAENIADPRMKVSFVFHESLNQFEEFYQWYVENDITLVGFNNLDFDAQVCNFIIKNKVSDPCQIYRFAQQIIETDRYSLPYNVKDFLKKEIDLYRICHYDNNAKRTSLKWLEFTMRAGKIKDLPIGHDVHVSKSKVTEVVRYNKVDVKNTALFFWECEPMIIFRQELAIQFNNRYMINMSNSSIGSYIMRERYAKATKQQAFRLKTGTDRKRINVNDIIFPYVKFHNEGFQGVHQFYKELVLVKEEGKDLLKGSVDEEIEFQGLHFTYGTGGLHAAYEKGVYESSDTTTILSIDVKSYYPNLAIKNRIYPKHLGEQFCNVYEQMYNERKEFPKGTAMNQCLKIALNGTYGKTGTAYDNFLRDHQFTAAITINGQLLLSMLCEWLAPHGQLLLVNTDGVELMVQNEDLEKVREICKAWEKLTMLTLEEDTYEKLILKDVNNYIAVSTSGDIKRKGMFLLYDDLRGGEHKLHMNPSANIIKIALTNYFVNGVDVDKTINECENIHEFLIGVKKTKKFRHLLAYSFGKGKPVELKFDEARVLRYYISTDGSSLKKYFNDGRMVGINKTETITNLPEAKNKGAFETVGKVPLYEDLDRAYYIAQTKKIISEVKNA